MNWDRKLSRPLELDDGTKLVTLRDAASAFDRYFSTVIDSGSLEAAIEKLMAAAKSGKRADILQATLSVERMLSWRKVLKE